MNEMKLLGNLILKADSALEMASIDGGVGGVNNSVLILPASPNIFFRKLMAHPCWRNCYFTPRSRVERARRAENDGSEDGRASAFGSLKGVHQVANFRCQFGVMHRSRADAMAGHALHMLLHALLQRRRLGISLRGFREAVQWLKDVLGERRRRR